MTAPCPVVAETDLLIIGGTAPAVELAIAARKAGLSVQLVSTRPYLGTDICAFQKYWPAAGVQAQTALGQSLFPDLASGDKPPHPMHIKLTLEQSMVNAGVSILLNSYPAALIRDEDQSISGAVITNRTGRQAILAKTVVDCSTDALLVKLTDSAFSKPTSGTQKASYVALYHDTPDAEPEDVLDTETLPSFSFTHKDEEQALHARRYTLEVDCGDGSPAALAQAHLQASQRCWMKGQFMGQESLNLAEAESLAQPADEVAETLDQLQLDQFKIGRGLYHFSSYSAVGSIRQELKEPIELMNLISRLAPQLIAEVECLSLPVAPAIQPQQGAAVKASQLRCSYAPLRELQESPASLEDHLSALPVFGEYDIVVVGGGTGGAPAGISAGRTGASTLVIESSSGLGGVGTMGQIAKYWFGNRVGFTAELDAAVSALEHTEKMANAKASWSVSAKRQWYESESMRVGTQVWYNSICAGLEVNDGKVTGLIVATPQGLGLVKCKVVVDSTGSADIPALAGCPTKSIGADHVAVQGTGLAGVIPGKDYNNSDHNFSDDSDTRDATAFQISSRLKFKDCFDGGQLVDSRERRQIIGEISLDPTDFMFERRFPDTICVASSNFDTHGFTVHPLFMVKPPDHDALWVDVPYRALLPMGIKNVLVTGLGVSAHRDALPVIRMQPDVQNQGFAAAYAAYMALQHDGDVRAINLKALQKHLVNIGNLPERVLTDQDNFPVDDATLASAVNEGWDDFSGVALCFSEQERSLPLLVKAYESCEDAAQRLRYAHILALMGDATGLSTLMSHIENTHWDKGWNYTGMGQFGSSMSELDSLIMATARVQAPEFWPLLKSKIGELDELPDFSHCRAVGEACEIMASYEYDEEACLLLAQLLQLEGLSGHSQVNLSEVQAALTEKQNEVSVRNNALRELHLARALYRSGDQEGLGETILKRYSQDLRGHFARHAKAVLLETKTPVAVSL